MTDATRVGTGEGEEELFDNCSVHGEGRTARPEERSLNCLHLAWRYETLVAVVRNQLGLAGPVTLLQRGMEKGSTGWRAVVCVPTRGCGQGRVRTTVRCMQTQKGELYIVESCLTLPLYGVVCCVHSMCAVPVGGSSAQWGNECEVAGTTWRSVSLESGVWSRVWCSRAGQSQARGDGVVPAVHPNPPSRSAIHSMISRATHSVQLVPRRTEHARCM